MCQLKLKGNVITLESGQLSLLLSLLILLRLLRLSLTSWLAITTLGLHVLVINGKSLVDLGTEGAFILDSVTY